jgi:hypothetical protein
MLVSFKRHNNTILIFPGKSSGVVAAISNQIEGLVIAEIYSPSVFLPLGTRSLL